jgi:hypothetical protein
MKELRGQFYGSEAWTIRENSRRGIDAAKRHFVRPLARVTFQDQKRNQVIKT